MDAKLWLAWERVSNEIARRSPTAKLVAAYVIEVLRREGSRVTNNVKPRLARMYNAKHDRNGGPFFELRAIKLQMQHSLAHRHDSWAVAVR